MLVLAAALALPAVRAAAAEHADVLKMVESARTPADHEKIAAHYEAEAKAARAKAAEHTRMGEAYKGLGSSIGKGTAYTSMPQHCANLAKSFEEEAKNLEAMAAAHRQLAKSAR